MLRFDHNYIPAMCCRLIILKLFVSEQPLPFGGKNKSAAGNKKVTGRPRK